MRSKGRRRHARYSTHKRTERSKVNFWSEGDQLGAWFYHPPSTPALFLPSFWLTVCPREGAVPRSLCRGICGQRAWVPLSLTMAALVKVKVKPRYEGDPERQRRGYKDAITFVQTIESVDPNRIGSIESRLASLLLRPSAARIACCAGRGRGSEMPRSCLAGPGHRSPRPLWLSLPPIGWVVSG